MTQAEEDILLEVQDLHVHFPVTRGLFKRRIGTVKAVDGVSFTLAPGRTLGLVGESGCGKSTTARAVLRLLDATSGCVRLDGEDLTALSGEPLRKTRRKMQMIFQDPYASLNPRMTVHDIIAEPLRTHGLVRTAKEANREVGKLMEQVGLSRAYTRRYPHEFSGGQRQRVGIARAIALKPKLIIADEPVSALDMSIRAQIINLLEELQRELGIALLLIAHDLAVVRHICHDVAVMYLGKIVERASARQLFRSPSHPYTQALFDAVPVPDPARERGRTHLLLAGEPPSPMAPPPGCAFHPRCAHALDVCKGEPPLLEDLKSEGEASTGHWVSCHLDEAPKKPAA